MHLPATLSELAATLTIIIIIIIIIIMAPILESNQSEVLWNLLIISHSRLFFYCSDALKQPGHAIE